MQFSIQPIAEFCASAVELTGILILTLLSLYALGSAIFALLRGGSPHETWNRTRQQLGRGILLGLEFLVAADIIHTVAVELTYETVTLLALVVLIRTFLSFTLEVEITGNWPWGNAQP